jgi:serine/threonine-protein kinase PknG
VRTDAPSPGPSTLFAARGRVPTDAPVGRALPRLVVDPDDPGAGTILALGNLDPHDVLESLAAHEPSSPEIDLWQVRTLIDLGDVDEAERRLAAVEAADPWAWRAWWYRGVIALERGDGAAATSQFDAVYRTLPGELAPKIALGFAHELAGRPETAARWYGIVARTDPAYTVASFGLGRCRTALGDRDGAVDALDAVPETSSAHLDASVTSVDLLVSPARHDVDLAAVRRAAAIVDRAGVDPDDRDRLRAPVLQAALQLVRSEPAAVGSDDSVFEVPCTEHALRLALESTFRAMAGHASSRAERIELVDRANSVRPRSIL